MNEEGGIGCVLLECGNCLPVHLDWTLDDVLKVCGGSEKRYWLSIRMNIHDTSDLVPYSSCNLP